MAITADDFRATLSRFASGVTIVTTRDGDSVHGITVSSFASLSLEPPLVGIAIDHGARAYGLLRRLPRFAVSVLRADQQRLSDHFAGRPVELDDDPFESLDGHPVVRRALAQLLCRTSARHPVGDHDLFVGRVERVRVADGAPLLYFRSDYRRMT